MLDWWLPCREIFGLRLLLLLTHMHKQQQCKHKQEDIAQKPGNKDSTVEF